MINLNIVDKLFHATKLLPRDPVYIGPGCTYDIRELLDAAREEIVRLWILEEEWKRREMLDAK